MEELNEVVFNCKLSVVDFDGLAFTWTNGTVWQCLDKALVNEAWVEMFRVMKVSHLLREQLDHAPFLIKCGHEPACGLAFRFLNVWRKHPNFLVVVEEVWQTLANEGRMLGFHRRLMNTKAKLRSWNAQVFRNVFQNLREAKKILQLREQEFHLMRDAALRATLGELELAIHRLWLWSVSIGSKSQL